eukprot:5628389-Amphidinium_carterae.1
MWTAATTRAVPPCELPAIIPEFGQCGIVLQVTGKPSSLLKVSAKRGFKAFTVPYLKRLFHILK